jgi:hypothetical protein
MSNKLSHFKRLSALQIKLNAGTSAALTLEMLVYIAELERKLSEYELPR